MDSKQSRNFLSILLTLALTLTLTATGASGVAYAVGPAYAAETDGHNIGAVIADTAAFIIETVPEPAIGQMGGEWAVIALVRSGAEVPESYIRDYYDRVAAQIDIVRGLLSSVKYSEYSRVALAIAAVGADPRNVGGYDTLAPLSDYDMTVNQGVNGPVFALIALGGTGTGDEEIIERYIGYILGRQLADGGFTLSGTVSDPDTTAMALTALSPYSSRADARPAIDRALDRLSQIQQQTGGFTSFSSTNSESVSQAIIALCSLGITMDDARFVKNGNTLLDNLLTYKTEGGGFEHERGGGVSLMATEQALCALAALRRCEAGQNALYDMSDAPPLPGAAAGGREGAHPDVSVPGVTGTAVEFNDIDGFGGGTAVRALAERGIVTGYSMDSFAPERTITRAEFATIAVRALGLGLTGGAGGSGDASGGVVFFDVPAGSWFFDYALTAHGYGIIEGRGEGVFDPGGTITRQEAAVIIARAAKLCGMNETFDSAAIRNILSQFIDYRSAAPWAAEALAFCYHFGILDDSEIEIQPSSPASRGETAGMVFRMLSRAGLL